MIDLGFQHAAALDAAGHAQAAQAAYLALLAVTPGHAGALNNLGSLLCRAGYRSAARTAFAHAAACHPGAPAGHVNLANLLWEDGAADQAQRHYTAALAADPDCREAHQGLGNVFAEAGNAARAAEHRRKGWTDRVFTPWRHGGGQPVRVLLLTSVAGGNVPVRTFLDDPAFAVTAVAAEFFDPAMPLPAHDLVFNAIGDADAGADALDAAARLASPAPLLNRPAAVRATARVANAERLGRGPGVRTARMATLPRAAAADPGFGFPLLLRAPGFHTGRHFVSVASAADLPAAAAGLPGDRVLAMEALPARGTDGMARKYRAMLVGGQVLPLHLAVSEDWKVHYFTAAMAERDALRAEEARFLDDMAGTIGPRACAALAWVAGTLGLDYAGVDFALDPAGGLLLFEANATMALVPPPPEAVWDYRRPAYAAAVTAARRLVTDSACRPSACHPSACHPSVQARLA